MKIGSEAHKEFFCRHFKETYQEFDPKALPWPELNAAELERLRSVPFWQEVFYTERRAGAIVAAFTETVRDPVLKEAIALQGFEEARHAELIREMIRRYGIDAQELPMEKLSADVETAFKDLEAGGFGKLPVCMAKTQYSFSTDANKRGAPTGHVVPVRELRLSAGAEFVVVITGEIMTMPGLPRVPAAEAIRLNAEGQIEGLF